MGRLLVLVAIVAALAAAVALVADDRGRPAAPSHPAPTEDQIARRLGLEHGGSAVAWVTRDGCGVAAVLPTASAVQTYQGAGDPVVASADGRTGVKLTPEGDTAACRQELARLLER